MSKRASGGASSSREESTEEKRRKVVDSTVDAADGASDTIPFDISRKRPLNTITGTLAGPVLYWMSREQRVQDNWALIYAQREALKRGSCVVVCFNVLPSFLGATIRHFGFMLRGLRQVESDLKHLGIPFVLLHGNPVKNVSKLLADGKFGLLVCDFSPLRVGVQWRSEVAAAASVPVHEVDAHNVVPVWVASDRLEYAARTIRPKIHAQLKRYLTEFPTLAHQTSEWTPPSGFTVGVEDWDAVIAGIEVDRTVPEVVWCTPGEKAGRAALTEFLSRLGKYAKERNNPSLPGERCSGLSPYFHFGQLAPQRAALEVNKLRSKHSEGAEAFLEEAIVRRELSDNYCHFNPRYDDLDGLYPQFNNDCWAQRTLKDHAKDKRQYVYTQEQLEEGKTHDELWNAAQLEMVHRGKMHGFMRMYWAKKILEWTSSPHEALRISIYLNDRYQLDGRDPNGYVGCAWSIAGVHDNGWTERPVFGKIRYMNYEGCKRKFDIASYVSKVKSTVRAVAKK